MSKEPDKITVEDAVRLKHEVNKAINYGGYDVREIRELERLNDEQRASLGAELSNIKKVWWFFPDWVMVIGSIAAIGSLFYFDGITARVVSVLVAIYGATQVAYRLGVYSGFARGYQEGHEQGVHRVLGISPDEAQDIDERATEMEMDERLIRKLDERKDRPSAL